MYTLIFSGVENTLQNVLNKIKHESITHNIFTTQDDNSILYEFHCIAIIEYVIAGKC